MTQSPTLAENVGPANVQPVYHSEEMNSPPPQLAVQDIPLPDGPSPQRNYPDVNMEPEANPDPEEIDEEERERRRAECISDLEDDPMDTESEPEAGDQEDELEYESDDLQEVIELEQPSQPHILSHAQANYLAAAARAVEGGPEEALADDGSRPNSPFSDRDSTGGDLYQPIRHPRPALVRPVGDWVEHPLARMTEPQQPWTREEYARYEIDHDFSKLVQLTITDYRTVENCKQLHCFHAHELQRKWPDYQFPITAVARMHDIAAFRQHARDVCSEYLQDPTAPMPVREGELVRDSNVTILKPPFSEPLPMLFRVIEIRAGRTLLIESMSFDVFYKQEELRYITLDNGSWNRTGGKRGVIPSEVSLGDFVWIHSLTITKSARQRRNLQLDIETARLTGIRTEDIRPVFNALDFDLVTPSTRPPALAYCLHTPPRETAIHKKDNYLAISSEHRPCRVSRLQNYNHGPYTIDTILMCTPRTNTPSSFYLTSIPSSREDDALLRSLVVKVEPTPPSDEAPTPTRIEPVENQLLEQIRDRLHRFELFKSNPENGLELLQDSLLLGATTHMVLESRQEDRRRHPTVFVVERSPNNRAVKLHFRIDNKSSEGGWRPGTRIVCSFAHRGIFVISTITQTKIEGTGPIDSIFVAIPLGSELNQLAAFTDRQQVLGTVYRVPVSKNGTWLLNSLARDNAPLGATTKARTAIRNIYSAQRGRHTLDQMPSTRFQTPATPAPSSYSRASQITLTTDEQKSAIQLLAGDYGSGALFSAFGAGKTTTIAVAARHRALMGRGVTLLASNTNNAIAELAEAVIETELTGPHTHVHRFLADGATETRTTAADIPTLAQEISEDPATDPAEARKQADFTRRRALMRDYLQGNLSDPQEIADAESVVIDLENPSAELQSIYKLICENRPPSILGATIGSLPQLKNGLFKCFHASVSTIMIDEASIVSEATLFALHVTFPHANLYLIGDIRQSQPYTRMAEGNRVRHWAMRPSLAVTLNSDLVPRVVLTSTWRAHPDMMNLANTVFYDSRLRTRIQPRDRTRFVNLNRWTATPSPVLFVVHSGRHERAANTSSRNLIEAELAAKILRYTRAHFSPEETLVVTYYNEQKALLQQILKRDHTENQAPRCTSVERAQGSQAELVLVLTTHSTQAHEGHFFADRHRACVAVTRARQGMIVLGSEQGFRTACWNRLFQYATEHGWVINSQDFASRL
ncbi:unnamed protein product, partial [Mesorhabditis spiculigera]